MKKAESAPRRLTPLNPKEENRARELERVLVDAGYAYAEAMHVYAESLKADVPNRERRVEVAGSHLSAAGAAMAGAALALRDVPAAYRP